MRTGLLTKLSTNLSLYILWIQILTFAVFSDRVLDLKDKDSKSKDLEKSSYVKSLLQHYSVYSNRYENDNLQSAKILLVPSKYVIIYGIYFSNISIAT